MKTFSSLRLAGALCLIACLQLFAANAASAQKITLLGFWNFDESRRAIYITSVNLQQENRTLGEIASQMGMGKIENSSYEFGVDSVNKKPYLKMIDKATKEIETVYLEVKVTSSKELLMTDAETGNTYTVKPLGNDKMTLIDNAKKLSIPLRRIND